MTSCAAYRRQAIVLARFVLDVRGEPGASAEGGGAVTRLDYDRLRTLRDDARDIDCVDLVDDPKRWRSNRVKAANLIAQLRDVLDHLLDETP